MSEPDLTEDRPVDPAEEDISVDLPDDPDPEADTADVAEQTREVPFSDDDYR